MLNITNIPAPRVDFIDQRTGLMSREWYRFFLNLFVLTGEGQNVVSLSDLQKGPPDLSVDEITELTKEKASLSPNSEALLSQIAELTKQVQASELTAEAAVSALQSQIMALDNNVQALAVQPTVTPQIKRARYGAFYDMTTQTATAINTAKAITFNTADISDGGVYIGTPTSRIYVDTAGVYNFDTSIQVDKTSGGTAAFYLWFRVNGVDVANSASYIQIQGNDAEVFSSLNYFFDLKADDYVEIMFSVSDLSVQLASFAAAAPVPAIPSIILTVANNIEGVIT
jgi:hypothetical protein